jgi:excisionase family DNA binding protein
MEKATLNGISIDELLSKLKELFDAKLEESKQAPAGNQSVYITRKEVIKTLKISLPTLDDYTKNGLLPSYKIGNRVLYKSEEIEQAISRLQAYKYKSFPKAA